jgi:hypothetical protein
VQLCPVFQLPDLDVPERIADLLSPAIALTIYFRPEPAKYRDGVIACWEEFLVASQMPPSRPLLKLPITARLTDASQSARTTRQDPRPEALVEKPANFLPTAGRLVAFLPGSR